MDDLTGIRIQDHDSKEKVLFYFKCADCNQVRRFFDNGEEYRPAPPTCSECQAPVNEKRHRNGSKFIWSYICEKCGHQGGDVLDLDEKPKKTKVDDNFIKDMEKFCFTKEQYNQYIDHLFRMEHFKNEQVQYTGANLLVNEEVRKIKMLTIVQVEELLHPVFEKSGFIALTFEKPDMKRGTMTISYSAQDYSMDEKPWNNRRRVEFKKSLDDALATTNWKVMSGETSYTLGLLKGWIKGANLEEDLRELARIRLKRAGKLPKE